MSEDDLICGGTLYTKNTVITAAHCCYQYKEGECNPITWFTSNVGNLSFSRWAKIVLKGPLNMGLSKQAKAHDKIPCLAPCQLSNGLQVTIVRWKLQLVKNIFQNTVSVSLCGHGQTFIICFATYSR